MYVVHVGNGRMLIQRIKKPLNYVVYALMNYVLPVQRQDGSSDVMGRTSSIYTRPGTCSCPCAM